jgi:ATP-dependent protease ClpP protease subunit
MSNEKSVCIEFFCGINEFTTNQLIDKIMEFRKKGFSKIKILMSSEGGSVYHALAVYNILKGIDVEIITHNFGNIDSSAGIIFSAGTKRYSVPHGKFLIHPLTYTMNGVFTEETMDEHRGNLKMDFENTAGVLAEATGRDEEQILKDMRDRKQLNPEEAMEYGLIDEIKVSLIEEGEEVCKINPQ